MEIRYCFLQKESCRSHVGALPPLRRPFLAQQESTVGRCELVAKTESCVGAVR